jgi:hypothetical protein
VVAGTMVRITLLEALIFVYWYAALTKKIEMQKGMKGLKINRTEATYVWAEMKSKSVQTQLNYIYYIELRVSTYLGHPQVHNLCVKHIDEGI